jgi:hypothetical protein
MSHHVEDTIEIRPARPDDERALARLGELDSARVPPGPLLLAFEGGEPRAALSLATGAAIADPFAPTARLVQLLRASAAPGERCLVRRSRPLLRRGVPAWRLEAVERHG